MKVPTAGREPRMTACRSPRKAAAIVAAAFWMLSTASALAHDPGLSALDIRVAGDRIVATVSLAAADANTARAAADGDLRSFAAKTIDVRLDGAPLAASSIVESSDASGASVSVSFPRAAGGTLTVGSAAPSRLARGHRQVVVVRATDGRVLAERVLDAREQAFDLRLDARAGEGGAVEFVRLGITHILGGYDHLLFVAALLLGVSGLTQLVRTVTAFTAAHSLTLALAVLDLVQVPAGIVEPLIAASIVFVGLENLVREPGASRWKLTFAFGLVHGFGFAGALQDLGIGGQGPGIVTALGAFNAGVEAGQIAVAGALWPIVSRLGTASAGGRRVAAACSVAIALAAAYWLAERTLF